MVSGLWCGMRKRKEMHRRLVAANQTCPSPFCGGDFSAFAVRADLSASRRFITDRLQEPYFATVSKMVKAMLITMQVIEKKKSSHSNIIFFIMTASSNSVMTKKNSVGLFYQISVTRRDSKDSIQPSLN